MNLSQLQKSRKTDFSKIVNELEKSANPEQKSYVDDRFWKPERDKAGNASATIRFLPRTVKSDDDMDDLPWVKIWDHGFKGPTGKWYIENCQSSLGQPCPCCECNSVLWNSTTDDNSPARKQARAQKRRLQYISNILVVDDPKHPENNGKTFLFKFGKKIFDKIMDKARPTFDDEEPVNVFDDLEGANFKLRMKQVDGYPNYDASVFAEPTPIAKTDEGILEIANQQVLLKEFLSPDNFKSYDEAKKKLEAVLASGSPAVTAMEVMESKAAPVIKSKPSAMEDEDEDMLSYFQALANDD